MRHIQLQLTILSLIGLGVVGYFVASSQAQSPQPLPLCSNWPPHPEDIVSISGGATFTGQGGHVVDVYTVPSDRWLVLTRCVVYTGNYTFQLIERPVGGGEVVKLASASYKPPGHYTSDIGLAFAPGSVVAVRDPDGVPNLTYMYDLTGYLRRP